MLGSGWKISSATPAKQNKTKSDATPADGHKHGTPTAQVKIAKPLNTVLQQPLTIEHAVEERTCWPPACPSDCCDAFLAVLPRNTTAWSGVNRECKVV